MLPPSLDVPSGNPLGSRPRELRTDLKDILKELFLWVDEPVVRLRNKQ